MIKKAHSGSNITNHRQRTTSEKQDFKLRPFDYSASQHQPSFVPSLDLKKIKSDSSSDVCNQQVAESVFEDLIT